MASSTKSTADPFRPIAEQETVISASKSARLIVNAGPGTGKTAVACARIAQLIAADGVSPTNIWLISFTRTAVKEIRDRIASFVGPRAYAIRITTLDQQAFQIVQGFSQSEAQRIFKAYDLTIKNATGLLSSAREEIREFFQSLDHLLVDEAQDVIGERAELVYALIRTLSTNCGVTVLSDDAQAIYGWTNDDNGSNNGQLLTLPELLRTRRAGFREENLRTVHRTTSKKLLSIFVDTRSRVLSAKLPGKQKLEQVRKDIEAFCDTKLGQEFTKDLGGKDDVLVLYRQRGEALKTSELLSRAGINHRVRLSRMPTCVHPWVAQLFWNVTDSRLSKKEFETLSRQKANVFADSGTAETIWTLLTRFAEDGRDVISMRSLRAVLARSRPPIEFTAPDIGISGPIVGTIHSSKGREARVVHLRITQQQREECDFDEEARVLFVGATRAKERLALGQGYEHVQRLKESGRSFYIDFSQQPNPASAEIGMDGDVDVVLQTSRRIFRTGEDVALSQACLHEMVGKTWKVNADTNKDRDYIYSLENATGRYGALNKELFNSDLFRISKKVNKQVPLTPRARIYDIFCVGVRSAIFGPDSVHLSEFHHPYDQSGIMLAPVICGFPTIPFRRRFK